MNSRMEKYNNENLEMMSRTEKNESLYSSLDISDLSRAKTNNNVSIISDAQKQIDIEKIKKYIYNEEEQTKDETERVKLDLPEPEEEKLERKEDKDYDILSVLQRAKSNRKVEEYENSRHRKINETGYELLKNIKIEKEEIEESANKDELNTQEKTIVDLIHTIAVNANNKEKEEDLFEELMSGNDDTKIMPIINEHENKPNLTEELKDVEAVKDFKFNKLEEIESSDESEKELEKPKVEKLSPEKGETSIMPGVDKSFFTNSMSFSKEDFEGFDDMEKKVNKSSAFTKIAIILIILVLITTGIIVANYIFELGWF